MISKSAMTPLRNGRIAWMYDGVRPIMRLASMPTSSGRLSRVLIATTEGSLSTMPMPRTNTSVLAVPRSIAISRPANEKKSFNKESLTRASPRNFGYEV